jgi:predicted GTPase/uncharacterized protein (DUF697 family)
MVDVADDDGAAEVAEGFADPAADLGQVNIAVFGPTGAGKSSLINAVFGAETAPTGVGEPVTQSFTGYVNPTGTLCIWDGRGYETGERKPLRDLRKELTRKGRARMDVAWFVIRDHRLDDGRKELIRELSKLGLPVIVVATGQDRRPGDQIDPRALQFVEAVREMDLPIVDGVPVLTSAAPPPWGEQHGLLELLERTRRVVPVARREALEAAQRIDQSTKRRLARTWIAGAAVLSGGVGAVPLPGSDAVLLVPAQLALMAKIATLYNIPKGEAMSAASLITAGAKQGGIRLAASIVGLVPGPGQVINAAVASTITAVAGESWRYACEQVFVGKMDLSQMDAVRSFVATFADGMKSRRGEDLA